MDDREITRKRARELMVEKGATMVAPGEKTTDGEPTGRRSIVVGVQEKVPLKELRPTEVVPRSLDGVETDVVVFHQPVIPTLLPKAVATDPRLEEQRPMFGGISCGALTVTAGTEGGRVSRSKLFHAVTNWHVGGMNDGKIGDPMLQPAVYDGGTLHDNYAGPISLIPPVKVEGEESGCSIAGISVRALNTVAWLAGSETRIPSPIKVYNTDNLVDLCLFGPFKEDELTSLILGIGYIDTRNWCSFEVGDLAEKSGRSSEVNSFLCQYINAAIRIGLGGIRWAIFNDMDVFGPGAIGGDSGSLILKKGSFQNHFVGSLLNAGSDMNTIGCAWRNVRAVGGLD